MPPVPTLGKRPVVLLTNDDGPPSDHSPNIFQFAKQLINDLGWEVRVVIPDGQRSWVGKGFAINQIITAAFFYPLEPDGRQGEVTTARRPLKEGETMEWVLLNGTPATCSNIGLHNLYPGEVDMLISGPNHGRNSSAAFALSSGTIGAAMAGALAVPIAGPSGQKRTFMPSIALSYGVVERPVPPRALELAHEVAVGVCKRLFDDWGWEDEAKRNPVQVYSVNVPLVTEAIELANRKVCFTTMWRNTYGQLFVPTQKPPQEETNWSAADKVQQPDDADTLQDVDGPLRFRFAPNFHPLLHPSPEAVPEGTDAWAFYHGYTSVTPLLANFAELQDPCQGFGDASNGRFW
ncbi:unnamed protein product [Cutaneotrichosporon oleaginosum]